MLCCNLAKSEIVLSGVCLGHAEIKIDAGGKRFDFPCSLHRSNRLLDLPMAEK